MAIKEHDGRLYKSLVLNLRQNVSNEIRADILKFWRTLIIEAYMQILYMFKTDKEKIIAFMELLDFMWIRSMYKMWLGGSINFAKFHEELFSLVVSQPIIIIDVPDPTQGTAPPCPCPDLYKPKHCRACHNIVNWALMHDAIAQFPTETILRPRVEQLVNKFVPNIRCACTTIDHFMKAFETRSPKIVGPLVKIFDHLTRDRAFHTDASGHAYYEDLCMDFSKENIPGNKVGINKVSRGFNIAMSPGQGVMRQTSVDGTSQGRWQEHITIPYEEAFKALTRINNERPLCVRPGEEDLVGHLPTVASTDDNMIEEFHSEEINSREWFEKSFEAVAKGDSNKLKLQQFNNGASIFTNALRSKNKSVKPLTFGMFSAGISGHTNELSMFIRLFMKNKTNDVDHPDMTPLIALSGLIWMLEFNHHSLREIFLGSMCLAPIKSTWGLPEVIPFGDQDSTEMELNPKLKGGNKHPIINYVSMLYKIISPVDADLYPDRWGIHTYGYLKPSGVRTPTSVENHAGTMTKFQPETYYHWTSYAEDARIHTTLIKYAIGDAIKCLKLFSNHGGCSCSPKINTLFNKIVLDTTASLSTDEITAVKNTVSSSLNAASVIKLLQRNGYDFSLDFNDKDAAELITSLYKNEFQEDVQTEWKTSAFKKEAALAKKFRVLLNSSYKTKDLVRNRLETPLLKETCANITEITDCLNEVVDLPTSSRVGNSFWKGAIPGAQGKRNSSNINKPMSLCNWSSDVARGFSKKGSYENKCTPRPLSSKTLSGLEKVQRSVAVEEKMAAVKAYSARMQGRPKKSKI